MGKYKLISMSKSLKNLYKKRPDIKFDEDKYEKLKQKVLNNYKGNEK